MNKYSQQLKAIDLITKENFKRLNTTKHFENVVIKGLQKMVEEKGSSPKKNIEALLKVFKNYSQLDSNAKKARIIEAKNIFSQVSGLQESSADFTATMPREVTLRETQAEYYRETDAENTSVAPVAEEKTALPTYPNKEGDPRRISVTSLTGVGKQTAILFGLLGIETLYDLLSYLPFRYENRAEIKTIEQLEFNQYETFKATVVRTDIKRTKRAFKTIIEVTLKDEKDYYLKLIYFTNMSSYLAKKFTEGKEVIVFGKVEYNGFQNVRTVVHPEVEEVEGEDDQHIHIGRIVPVYKLTKNLTQRKIRTVMFHAVREFGAALHETLPEHIVRENRLLSRTVAFHEVHFPEAKDVLKLNFADSPAHKRLKFEEMFLLQYGLLQRKKNITYKRGRNLACSDSLLEEIRNKLGFELTNAQKRVIHEIRSDMASDSSMNRLLQGDVGSGKTAVALHALAICCSNGYQSAMMAPTEILAFQHYINLQPLLEELGYNSIILTSGIAKKEKEEIYQKINNKEIDVVFGTHAIIQDKVEFKELGLVIIDEQHKFGVKQRVTLMEKGSTPELLVMTATPIPRTLTLTLFGDLSVSVIDEMPANRKPVLTEHFTSSKKKKSYTFMKRAVDEGRQGYILFPLVEESELIDLQAAEKAYEELRDGYFSAYKVGLLHGRMKNKEKEEVMGEFKKGNLDVLVSTTVIEVGVDVPNASVMIIEHAERFGLSQLHQLRGRVGRGSAQSWCFLISYKVSQDGKKRIEVMVESNDGFYIAEKDLEIRGPGNFLGTQQTGLPDLKWINILRDKKIIDYTRNKAEIFFNKNPDVESSELRNFKNELKAWWHNKSEFLNSG
ncbi:MAG: ATP-dependent DNA helicase RecG [Nitrospinae bacterium]|nr:ATP-dependent DNA helicase RecG [Nitrospinota bacterium]